MVYVYVYSLPARTWLDLIKFAMLGERWQTTNGKRQMANGKRLRAKGKWQMASGKRQTTSVGYFATE